MYINRSTGAIRTTFPSKDLLLLQYVKLHLCTQHVQMLLNIQAVVRKRYKVLPFLRYLDDTLKTNRKHLFSFEKAAEL